MAEPSEHQVNIAILVAGEVSDLYRENKSMPWLPVSEALVTARREAIEECAAKAKAQSDQRRIAAETYSDWRSKSVCLDEATVLLEFAVTLSALADQPAPAAPPGPSQTPLSAPSIHRMQDNTYVREPSEAEVEAAHEAYLDAWQEGSTEMLDLKTIGMMLAAAAKVRAR